MLGSELSNKVRDDNMEICTVLQCTKKERGARNSVQYTTSSLQAQEMYSSTM